MATYTRPTGRPLTRNRWGIISWVFMRVSALALIILTLGHFLIQHLIFDVHDLTIEFVRQRWSTLGWRVYAALLLTLGVAHGMNGLRLVMDDYVINPRWNRLVRWAILIVGTLVTLVGAIALIGGVRQV